MSACKGSGRSGCMPGATKRGPEEWEQYDAGRLWCPYCLRYVPHGSSGLLVEHARSDENADADAVAARRERRERMDEERYHRMRDEGEA